MLTRRVLSHVRGPSQQFEKEPKKTSNWRGRFAAFLGGAGITGERLCDTIFVCESATTFSMRGSALASYANLHETLESSSAEQIALVSWSSVAAVAL